MISQLVDLPPGLTTASATSRLHLGPQACFPPWVTSPLRRSLQPPPQPSSPLPPALSSCEYKTFIPPPCFLCPCGAFFVAVFSSWALRSVLLPKNTVSEQQRSETSDASWPEGSCCVGNGEKYAISLLNVLGIMRTMPDRVTPAEVCGSAVTSFCDDNYQIVSLPHFLGHFCSCLL